MATTTNYGWTTPNDTDLVKDGAAAIRTLGSSVDTTTKALNPSTTLGDIEYRSSTANTNTRLAIGTTGQVLTVAGGVPTWATSDDANAIQNALLTTTGDTIYASGASTPARLGIGSTGQVLTVAAGVPSWATPAGGASGLTLIQRSTFSNVAGTSTTFDGVFTSTYKSYLVVLEYVYGTSATNDLQLQGIYSGTTSTANYVGSSGYATYNSASFSNIQNNVTSQFTMTNNVGVNQSAAVTGQLFFTNVGNSSVNGRISGQLYDGQDDANHFVGCNLETRLYTGFLLKSSSSNITGIVAVYGLAAA
jgi:hypothetical protein